MLTVAFGLVGILFGRCVGASMFHWMADDVFSDLRDGFFFLDHNGDGKVTIGEAKLGLLAVGQTMDNLDIEYKSQITSFIPEKYTCLPSLDVVDLIDCVTISTRVHYASVEYDDDVLDFKAIIHRYFNDCSDDSPNDKLCSNLMEVSPQMCRSGNYCQLSCYQCATEARLFNKLVRGTNGQYYPRSVNFSAMVLPNDNIKSDNLQLSGELLFVSDVHNEPWYHTETSDGPVSRFSGANINNMFECRVHHDSAPGKCYLNGKADCPIEMVTTAMDYLGSHKSSNGVLFYPGDTQAHSYTSGVDSPLVQTSPKLVQKFLDVLKDSFQSSHIMWTCGNNDGSHNAIFTSGGDWDVSHAFGNVLINGGVVTDELARQYQMNGKWYGSAHFFNETGYYMKKIPGLTHNGKQYYALILNTNHGQSSYNQDTAFSSDFDYVAKQGGYAIVMGHYPDQTKDTIPSKYSYLVKGIFTGHVHYFQPSDSKLFMICPATTQSYDDSSGILVGDLNSNGEVKLDWGNFIKYHGTDGEAPWDSDWYQ